MGILLKVEGFTVKPTAEALSIECFKKVLSRDKDKNKSNALKELAFIEFMTSPLPTNPFRNYSDDSKESEIRKRLVIPKSWKPDRIVKDCISFILQVFKEGSIVYRYYETAKSVVEKNMDLLNNVDITEEDENGKPKYKMKDITDIVTTAPGILKSLKELGEKVAEDRFETISQRAGRERSVFADPDSLKGVL